MVELPSLIWQPSKLIFFSFSFSFSLFFPLCFSFSLLPSAASTIQYFMMFICSSHKNWSTNISVLSETPQLTPMPSTSSWLNRYSIPSGQVKQNVVGREDDYSSAKQRSLVLQGFRSEAASQFAQSSWLKYVGLLMNLWGTLASEFRPGESGWLVRITWYDFAFGEFCPSAFLGGSIALFLTKLEALLGSSASGASQSVNASYQSKQNSRGWKERQRMRGSSCVHLRQKSMKLLLLSWLMVLKFSSRYPTKLPQLLYWHQFISFLISLVYLTTVLLLLTDSMETCVPVLPAQPMAGTSPRPQMQRLQNRIQFSRCLWIWGKGTNEYSAMLALARSASTWVFLGGEPSWGWMRCMWLILSVGMRQWLPYHPNLAQSRLKLFSTSLKDRKQWLQKITSFRYSQKSLSATLPLSSSPLMQELGTEFSRQSTSELSLIQICRHTYRLLLHTSVTLC